MHVESSRIQKLQGAHVYRASPFPASATDAYAMTKIV